MSQTLPIRSQFPVSIKPTNFPSCRSPAGGFPVLKDAFASGPPVAWTQEGAGRITKIRSKNIQCCGLTGVIPVRGREKVPECRVLAFAAQERDENFGQAVT